METFAFASFRRANIGTRNHQPPLRLAFELRFQVYCIEYNFLSPDDYPDGVESDEHDERAAHFYAFDSQDELVGYVRLVHADGGRAFPIQEHCTLSVDENALPAPGQAAEVSRLMVRSDYRRQRGSRLSGVTAEQNQAAFAGDKRHESPQILLSLYRQMYAYSRSNGITHWYAAMERTLARSLQRMNFSFQAIGPQTDYYGPVAPYLADLRTLEFQLRERNPALLKWMEHPERSYPSTTHSSGPGLCPVGIPVEPVSGARWS